MLLIPIELNKNIKHAYKHAYKLKFFSPFLSIINKGVKNKTNKKNSSPLFVQNKESIKGCSPPFGLKQKRYQWGVKSNMLPIKNVSMKCILIPIKNETIPIEKQKSWYQLISKQISYQL